MIEQDIFVGIVAVALGVFVGCSAIGNAQWYSRFWLSRVLNQSSRAHLSRPIGVLIGLALTLLGILILLGYFSQHRGQTRREMKNPDQTNRLSIQLLAVSRLPL